MLLRGVLFFRLYPQRPGSIVRPAPAPCRADPDAFPGRNTMRLSPLLAALLALSTTPAMADDLTLFAAGSLKAALTDVVAGYGEATGTAVATRFGPSGLMRERIEGGETAHVFASANMRHPMTLEAAVIPVE